MRSKRLLGVVASILVVAILGFVAVGLIFEDSAPGRMLRGTTAGGAREPVYAEATVDGEAGEWDLNADLFADMPGDSKSGSKVEAQLYLRYSCEAGQLSVLILSAGDWPLLAEEGEAWLALDSSNNRVVWDEFAWVDAGYDGNATHARGFEASLPIVQGTRTFWAHTSVLDDEEVQASGTAAAGIAVALDCYVPTAVSLNSFTAKLSGQRVVLRWETSSEMNNLGFNIYHATSSQGPWTKLNQELIPSQVPPGSPVGARYGYEHTGVDANAPHFYLLEDVDAAGPLTQHGPIVPE